MLTFSVALAQFLTGSYVALPLLPAWLQTLCAWLPFTGMLNVPTQVFFGKMTGTAFWLALFGQIGWLIVLTLCVQWLTMYARRRVIAQGG
jgi:ABC-2 type transport system permease protein